MSATATPVAKLPAPVWRRALGWVAVPVVTAVHFLAADPGYPPFSVGCASALAAASLLAFAYARPRVVPVLPLVLVQLYLSLGSAVFWPPTIRLVGGRLRLPARSLDEAALGSVLFAAAAAVVYLAARHAFERVAPGIARYLDRHEYTPVDSALARSVAVALVLLYCIAVTGEVHSPVFGSFAHLVTLVTLPSIPLGLLLWDQEKTGDPASGILMWTTLAVMSVIGLSNGMLASVVGPVVSLSLLTWTLRGRLPLAPLMLALLVVLSLNRAKHIYRDLSWQHRSATLSLADKATNWLEAIERTYSGSYRGESTIAFSESAESTAGRFLTLPQIAHIFDWVPTRIPHAGPDQWLRLPLEFVPRALWRDKPVHIDEYNHRYTLTFRLQTREGTRTTAVALPPVGDGYWRLSWVGVAIEGALLGLLLGFYQGLGRSDSRALTIMSCAAVASISAEAHVMALFAGFPQFTLAILSVFVVLNGLVILMNAGKRRRFVIRAKPKLEP